MRAWVRFMLEEIRRKEAEAEAARLERERRAKGSRAAGEKPGRKDESAEPPPPRRD